MIITSTSICDFNNLYSSFGINRHIIEVSKLDAGGPKHYEVEGVDHLRQIDKGGQGL